MVPLTTRPPDIVFREKAVGKLTADIGVYVLYDLDDVAVYVGQTVSVSERGIRGRVQRHLTSARSDPISNRQIDVWEIAFVRAWPESDHNKINELEASLYYDLNPKSTLMNGKIPTKPTNTAIIPAPAQMEQVLPDEVIKDRLNPSLRLPRQVEHYGQMVSHYLTVKDSAEIARSMVAHFERLQRYHAALLAVAGPAPTGTDE